MIRVAPITIEKKIYTVSKVSLSKIEDYKLQKLMKNVILVGQWVALLPVDGVTKQAKNLKFKWTSLKFIYSTLTLIACTAYTAIVATSDQVDIQDLKSIINLFWNVRALILIVLFMKVARKWPRLLKDWTKMETNMLSYGPPERLKRRFNSLSITFIMLGIIQYVIFIAATIYTILESSEGEDLFEKYFKVTQPEFFSVYTFNIIAAVFVQFQSLVSTVGWQFNNLIVILLTSSLAERFLQLNKRLSKDEFLDRKQWREIRQQYTELTSLCKDMNDAVSENILISIVGTTLYLSVFIFQSLQNRTTADAIYFWYKILFVLFHFLAVCMYLPWISEENRCMVSILFDKGPKQSYYEINCFMQQCAINNTSINACGLFKVHKSIILDIVVIMVTIQLIYFQFYGHISVAA